MFGPPGSGKGTQSEKLIAKYGFKHLSTGDILRSEIANQTQLGLEAKSFMDAGKLVPDAVVIGMVGAAIAANAGVYGFLFDGFPRTIPQAEAMVEAGVDLDHVVEIDVADEAIVARLGGRRVHPGSGRIYHIEHNPPQREGLDDETGEPLVQRDDDSEATIRKRLEIYHTQTSPLIAFYRSMTGPRAPACHRVEGVGTVDEIREKVFAALES